jgi:hypothetical protein
MEDPWVEARYSSDANGKASFAGIVDIGTDDIEGHAFVGKQTTGKVKGMEMYISTFYLSYVMLSLIHQSVHAADGSRVGCGLLTKADGNKLLSTKMKPLTEADADGRVTVLDLGAGVCFFGLAENLEPNLLSFLVDDGTDCDALNGCGAHIHSGYSCDDTTTQGGRFYNNDPVSPDELAGYLSTDSDGTGYFTGCLETGETDYANRAFIVHNSGGDRVSCGLLNYDKKHGKKSETAPVIAPTNTPINPITIPASTTSSPTPAPTTSSPTPAPTTSSPTPAPTTI